MFLEKVEVEVFLVFFGFFLPTFSLSFNFPEIETERTGTDAGLSTATSSGSSIASLLMTTSWLAVEAPEAPFTTPSPVAPPLLAADGGSGAFAATAAAAAAAADPPACLPAEGNFTR